MDLNSIATSVGFAVSLSIICVTIARQKRFEASDIGSFAAAFLSGTNIPPSLVLCAYAIVPDPPTVATKLHGFEKFVSLAGLSLLLVSLVSIWGLWRKAYDAAS